MRVYLVVAAVSVLLIASVCGPADASRTVNQQQADASPTPALTRSSAALPSTPTTASATLTGLSGRLTYETASEDVTVQFPDGIVIERHAIPAASSGQVSADGEWRSSFTCVDDDCTATTLTLIDASGAKRDVRVAGSIVQLQWAPVGHALAIKVGEQ